MTEMDAFTEEQLRLIRSELLPPETGDGEFELFIQQCYRTRLDPFARHIQGTPGFSKGRFKLTVVVTIDGFRAIADRSGEYDGQTEQEWCGPDGVWRTVWLDHSTPPSAARCGVYKRGSSHPSFAVMAWDESPGPGSRSPVWKGMPAHMLSKCAEALALRKAFPNQLGGLYTTDELPAAQGRPAPVSGDSGAPAGERDTNADHYELGNEGRAVFMDRLRTLQGLLDAETFGRLKADLIEAKVMHPSGHVVDPMTYGERRAGVAIVDAAEQADSEAHGDREVKAAAPLKGDVMEHRPSSLSEDEFVEWLLAAANVAQPEGYKPSEGPRRPFAQWSDLQHSRPSLLGSLLKYVDDGGELDEFVSAAEPFEDVGAGE